MKGEELKDFIKASGYSVKAVADKANIPPTTLYSILERNGNMRFDHAMRIASVLNLPVYQLCDDVPDNAGAYQYPDNLSPRTTEMILEHVKSESDLRELENFLESFYMLTDEGREQIVHLCEYMTKQKKRRNGK